jgi:hypothetical protein
MDLNRDVIRAYDRYYRPRGYGYNMPNGYDGEVNLDDDRLRIQQKKTWPVFWDDKKENVIEQD